MELRRDDDLALGVDIAPVYAELDGCHPLRESADGLEVGGNHDASLRIDKAPEAVDQHGMQAVGRRPLIVRVDKVAAGDTEGQDDQQQRSMTPQAGGEGFVVNHFCIE